LPLTALGGSSGVGVIVGAGVGEAVGEEMNVGEANGVGEGGVKAAKVAEANVSVFEVQAVSQVARSNKVDLKLMETSLIISST